VSIADELWNMGLLGDREKDDRFSALLDYAHQTMDDASGEERAANLDLIDESTGQQVLTALRIRLQSREHQQLMWAQTRRGRAAAKVRQILRKIW
jgi:hypothetical protein